MHYQKVIDDLIKTGAHTAIKYLGPKEVIRATRKAYKGKFHKNPIEILITSGRPNYKERYFIKDCIKAGEKFPIRKVQLKFLGNPKTYERYNLKNKK